MTAIGEKFSKAVNLMAQENYEAASKLFMELQKIKEVSPACCYQLATISNITGDPETAYSLYYRAFKEKPDIAKQLYGNQHPNHTYVFRGIKPEVERLNCPLCENEAKPRWCYSLVEAVGYTEQINPIRMWMYCQPCHHMFARHFPEKLFLHNSNPRKANPIFFSYYSQILGGIRAKGFSTGMSLFEVGIGASECLLAAREIGYETFGIDVIERHVEDAKRFYGLNVETADFNEYESDRKWDVIIMGDVLEHVNDPVKAVEKAAALLKDDGAVWISTPSFESAFSNVVGHADPMRKQTFHLNYFSRESLYALLEKHGLVPVDYHISGHYNGSMEVVAVKACSLVNP